MIDPTPLEIASMEAASAGAGEYLESIGETDLVRLTPEQWMTLIEVIVTQFCDTLRGIVPDMTPPRGRA